MLIVLGVIIVHDPLAGAAALTLLAGALFLVVGVTRLFAGAQVPQARSLLIVSGILSIILGDRALQPDHRRPVPARPLLGVQIVIEGVTLLVAGRLRPRPVAAR